MKEKFLKIQDHDDVAAFFGLTYKQLSKIVYHYSGGCKYTSFEIPKKNGETRKIKSPCKKLKVIQRHLKDVLYQIYPVRPSAFGFIKNRSIVQNAEKHLNKRYVFNIDLKDFFGSIHYGRVMRLFQSKSFCFNKPVSIILAQICCVDNCLPQGAPTSPILSNMIAWKLDAQLQKLAKQTNSTYTRYADDITFSFSCRKKALPADIVKFEDDSAIVGHKLSQIIVENGFEVNTDKVRLATIGQRMEVTGLTINEFPNVRRKYVRQISSLLHSWRKFGYKATSDEFNSGNYTKHRPSGEEVSLLYFIKGKLSFLRSVRSGTDPIFNKLAIQYNELVEEEFPDKKVQFKVFKVTEPESKVIDSLWVIETCYDDPESGEVKVEQGTGFSLEGVGIITCAHVVSQAGNIFKHTEIFKYDQSAIKYTLNVNHLDTHRDVAICSIVEELPPEVSGKCVHTSKLDVTHQMPAKMFGFPAYKAGQSYFVSEGKVATTYVQSGVAKFEIDQLIRAGISGGPVVSVDGELLGIALEGASQDEGNNAVLRISELLEFIASLKPKTPFSEDAVASGAYAAE